MRNVRDSAHTEIQNMIEDEFGNIVADAKYYTKEETENKLGLTHTNLSLVVFDDDTTQQEIQQFRDQFDDLEYLVTITDPTDDFSNYGIGVEIQLTYDAHQRLDD